MSGGRFRPSLEVLLRRCSATIQRFQPRQMAPCQHEKRVEHHLTCAALASPPSRARQAGKGAAQCTIDDASSPTNATKSLVRRATGS